MAETVGSLVDKLSILTLKIYHMDLQVSRKDSPESHRQACVKKGVILREQRSDLIEELNDLMRTLLSGKRKMKVYRQFKMYNNPAYRFQIRRR